MIIPTEADWQAARNAMERAVDRFQQNRPDPGSMGALGLMVEESAVEIARARGEVAAEASTEIEARIAHAIGPATQDALNEMAPLPYTEDEAEHDLIRRIIRSLPDDRVAGLRVLNSARALVMRFKR